jgi:YNFM family putative membrane transporter
VIIAGLLIITAGFFGSHAVASGWAGARGRALNAQGAAVYLLCYYLGSSVGGSVGGLAYAADGWSGTVWYAGALVAGALVLGFTLRAMRSTTRYQTERSGR